MIAEYNTSGVVLWRHICGAGTDESIVWHEGAKLTTQKYYNTANQGSITAITNGTGNVTNKNKYNECGVPDLGNMGHFQYTGQIWLAEAQIYHYKARAYDPYLGRFLQTNPIGYGDELNMYAYVGGDPVNYNGATGLMAKDQIISYGTHDTSCFVYYSNVQRTCTKSLLYEASDIGVSIIPHINNGSSPGKSDGDNEEERCSGDIWDNLTFIKLHDSWDQVPSAIRNHSRGRYVDAVSSKGHHPNNIRGNGRPGGYHLANELDFPGAYAHFDARNGTNGLRALFSHGQEVGSAPLLIYPIFYAKTPKGHVDENTPEASQSFEQYCGK